jgi:transposase
MLTHMTEEDWEIVPEVFQAVRSRRGGKGGDDRRFLEALHYFTVDNITWRALPAEFGPWNTVWRRFWRLSQSGTFEAFFKYLRVCRSAGIIQKFDATKTLSSLSLVSSSWSNPSTGPKTARDPLQPSINLWTG